MQARGLIALCVLAFSGCTCAAETSALEGDAHAVDTGRADAGTLGCGRAADCPGLFPPCDDPAGCGCGTFKTCRAGLCQAFSNECPGDDAGLVIDGGALFDAGSALDAGATPDATIACRSAQDCAGPSLPMVGVCSGSSHSCIDGFCVWECTPIARTCERSVNDCQVCEGTQLCPGFNCEVPSGSLVNRVEEATPGCALIPGTSQPFAGSPISMFATARPCSFGLQLDNRFIGFMLRFEGGGAFASLPDFGGSCTVTEAPTGALRFIFSCPACQFVLGP